MGEDDFEQESVLPWLEEIGWKTFENDTEATGNYQRSTSDIIFWNELEERLIDINDVVTPSNVERVRKKIETQLRGSSLMEKNKNFHSLLARGIEVKIGNSEDGSDYEPVHVIDFDNPKQNNFVAVSQFSIEVDRQRFRRPDIVLFVNGIPAVVAELKTASKASVTDAIRDIQTYETEAENLFTPVVFNVAATQTSFRYGAVNSSTKYYHPWTTDTPDQLEDVKQKFQSLCDPDQILDFIDDYVMYESNPDGGLTKLIPRHQQYHATERILSKIASHNPSKQVAKGLVWHTQGSGKSYTMLLAARHLVREQGSQVLIVVDSDGLREQMLTDLRRLEYGFEAFTEAESMDHLKERLESGGSEILVTTVQMFEENIEDVQGNESTVVLVDEAHRYMEQDLGSYLDNALENAHEFGFTGTPLAEESEKGRNTFVNYSNDDEDMQYLHRYSMSDAVDEEVITEVNIESRVGMLNWTIPKAELDAEFEREFNSISQEERRRLISDIGSETIAEHADRVEIIAEDIVDHFTESVQKSGLKGMVVTPTRRSASLYGSELQQHLGEDAVEVLITKRKNDDELISQFHTTSSERESIVDSFKEQDSDIQLLVVCDMLLTGFDAPILKTIYLDRKLRDHKLLQAIARTNRPREGKRNGEIVDYQGATADIESAISDDNEIDSYVTEDNDQFYEEFVDKLADVRTMFDTVDWEARDGTQETISNWLDCLRTEEEQMEFKQHCRKLKTLYETLSPDRRLVDHRDEYAWLQELYNVLLTTTEQERSTHIDDEFEQKTKEIIDEKVSVSRNSRKFPTYTISGEDISDGAFEVNRKVSGLRKILSQRTFYEPRYEELSERVENLVERWEADEITVTDALNELEDIEAETAELEDEHQQSDLNAAERAIAGLLVMEYDDDVKGVGEANSIAQQVYQYVVDNTNLNGGGSLDYTRRMAKNAVSDALLRGDITKPELAIDESFHTDAVDYIIRLH